MPKKIFIIAGEASGDLHGAHLIEAIRKSGKDDFEFYGVGGDKIKESGAGEFYDLAHFHVTGITDAIKRLPEYKKAEKVILASVRRVHPDVIVFIDNPGFNLHLAEKLHDLGIPMVYYIAPQVWAWGTKRIFKIKKYFSKVLVVFEFEKKIYEDQDIPVECVGHPLKDLLENIEKDNSQITGRPFVSLLPGSRKGELKMLMKTFLETSDLLSKKVPGIQFGLIKAPTFKTELYERFLKDHPNVKLIERNSYGVIKASDLAIVCSGTATLECAVLQVPMVISYKGTWITYQAAKRMIKVPHLGLPNLILQKRKFPELLQYDATPEKIAKTALHLLQDKKAIDQMKKDLETVSNRLGSKGATRRAAEEVLKLIK